MLLVELLHQIRLPFGATFTMFVYDMLESFTYNTYYYVQIIR